MTRFIDQHRERFGVEPIGWTLEASASAYYQRASGSRSQRVVEDRGVFRRIEEVHQANWEAHGNRLMPA